MQRSYELLNNKLSSWQNSKSYSTDNKKRKASRGSDISEAPKRLRPATSLPEFLSTSDTVSTETNLQSENLTPVESTFASYGAVDEDEWAAFEADIAASEKPEPTTNIVISAPALTSEETKKKSIEEELELRRVKEDAELIGDKEDAAQKMEEELQKMEILEGRVKRLRAKREELRKKQSIINLKVPSSPTVTASTLENGDSDEDDDDNELWDDFSLNG